MSEIRDTEQARRVVRSDPRIEATRDHLRRALVSLVHERDYDTIAVKQILHRANVGRTTFYAHFNDKDALLASSIHEVLASARAKGHSGLTWFSLPILEYHERHRRAHGDRMSARGRTILHEQMRTVLVQLVTSELQGTSTRIPPDLLADHVASTFTRVIEWWIESGSPLSAQEVDALFRALIHNLVP